MDSAASLLANEIKSRSAGGAAKKLASLGGGEIAATLMRLSPGFGQDVLAALPDEARERVFAAAPPDVTRQWQRNALYDEGAIGGMVEPVIGAFHPGGTVGETIEALREM